MPIRSTSNTLLVLGAGGHGRVVTDAALLQAVWEEVLVSDEDSSRWGAQLMRGMEIRPLAQVRSLAAQVHVAIGDATVRERLGHQNRGKLATVIHPRAAISGYATVGEGAFLAAQSVVAAGATIGMGVIVNHGAVVDHDCDVGDFTHVAPQAALGGGVRLGRRVLLGSGAHVLPQLSVCDDVVIGSGAVICRSITEPGVYAGVPARRIR